MKFVIRSNQNTIRSAVHAVGCRHTQVRHAVLTPVEASHASAAAKAFDTDNDTAARGLKRTLVCPCAKHL